MLVGAPNWAGDHSGVMRYGRASLFSGKDGEELRWWTGPAGTDIRAGHCVRGTGDLDPDGVPDLLVGYADHARIYNSVGFVEVYSGATSAVIFRFDPVPGINAAYGRSDIRADRDLNGDGINEIVIGDEEASRLAYWNGRVECRDGRTGQILWTANGASDYDAFGASLALLGDVNGDGFGDVATSEKGSGGGVRVVILSGRNGFWLATHYEPWWSAQASPNGFDAAGDVDGDGLADVVIAYRDGYYENERGSLWLRRGYDGAVLHRWCAPEGNELHFARSAANVGDLDGDGFADLAAGSHRLTGSGYGVVHVFSGRTKELLATLEGGAETVYFGVAEVSGRHDLNGDGLDDFAAADPGAYPVSPFLEGSVTAFAFDPFLRVPRGFASAAAGDSLALELAFPASEAGRSYAVLASGNRPGSVTLGGAAIPLAMSPLLYRSATDPPAFLQGARGRLDASGRASCVVTVHQRVAAGFAGKTVKLAAVAFSDPRQPSLSSAPVYLDILP